MVLRGSKTKGTSVQHFIYGGTAGACSRTIVAPLDRIKILMQTTQKTSSIRSIYQNIIKQEGITSLWKGNMLNCCRIIPYSALQFGTYDYCKSFQSTMNVRKRLICGTIAGVTAATITHPIDVIRHRLIMSKDIHTLGQAMRDVLKEQRGLFKGYGSTISSLVPFIAINFMTFDTLKSELRWTSVFGILSMGAAAALCSQTICYPLDTVRRRMQIRDTPYKHGVEAIFKIIKQEGYLKLYAGMTVNALKIIPNNSIRFLVYELCNRSWNF